MKQYNFGFELDTNHLPVPQLYKKEIWEAEWQNTIIT